MKKNIQLLILVITSLIFYSCGTSSSESNSKGKAEVITENIKTIDEVIIGTQTWTTKNLDLSTYSNGDSIPQVQDVKTWSNLTTGAWCYYENQTANGTKYGKLYNWYAVNDPRGLAPTGYHIPTKEEWAILITNLGGPKAAEAKMKSISGWNGKAVGTNSSGFSGLPSGFRNSNTDGTRFREIGESSYWWSSTETLTSENHKAAYYCNLNNSDLYIGVEVFFQFFVESGLPVRCLKGEKKKIASQNKIDNNKSNPSSSTSNSFNSSTNNITESSDNITESSDCSDIVKAYELAVRKNITALRKIHNNSFVSQNELISLDKDIRKWQDIVMKKCAFDPKYANRVLNIMQQLDLGYNSTFPSIKENSSSSSSNSQNSSSSSSSENKCKYCWKKQGPIMRYDLSKQQYNEDNGDGEMRPGSIKCHRCKGFGKITQGAFSSTTLITCLDCKGTGWLKCENCKGSGFTKF